MKSKSFVLSAIFKALGLVGLSAFTADLYRRFQYLLDSNARSRNARFKSQALPDGLPAPSPHQVYLVSNQYDIEAFYQNGIEGTESIKAVLEGNGLNIDDFDSILDFGCGCGRIMRHWNALAGPTLSGTDYNPLLVNWCKTALSFADFKVNKSCSPLDYNDGEFDFIYVISIFTHLSEKAQFFWIQELKRILKPGGYLLITVHGTTRLRHLTPEQRQEFKSGQAVVIYEGYSGKNICNTFHPEKYVRQNLCKDLTVVDFVPGGAKDADQDVFLMRNPVTSGPRNC
jgi:SAM-dependent methyltransferase